MMLLAQARTWTPDSDPTKEAESLAQSPAAIAFFVFVLAVIIAMAWQMVRARRARRKRLRQAS